MDDEPVIILSWTTEQFVNAAIRAERKRCAEIADAEKASIEVKWECVDCCDLAAFNACRNIAAKIREAK